MFPISITKCFVNQLIICNHVDILSTQNLYEHSIFQDFDYWTIIFLFASQVIHLFLSEVVLLNSITL